MADRAAASLSTPPVSCLCSAPPAPQFSLSGTGAGAATASATRATSLLGGGVVVAWDDGLQSHYHPLWLRENAPDPETCHPVTREQRLMLHLIAP